MHGDVNTPPTGEGYQLGMLRIRRDGFVSVEGDYVFNVPLTQVPQFVTVPLLPPSALPIDNAPLLPVPLAPLVTDTSPPAPPPALAPPLMLMLPP